VEEEEEEEEEEQEEDEDEDEDEEEEKEEEEKEEEEEEAIRPRWSACSQHPPCQGGGDQHVVVRHPPAALARHQGRTLAHIRAHLEDLRDTLLRLELNLSTSGTHPRVRLGYVGFS